jgi:peptide/nickel transport system permease protein
MRSLVRLAAVRLAISLIVLFGVSILIFAIARVIPGDPARIALGPNATAEAVLALRAKLHLDAPFVTQYAIFFRDLMHGDLGQSLYTNRPVTQDIAQFLPASMELVLVSGVMMVGLGLPLGVIAARYKGRWMDATIRVFALLTVSAPAFVWAVILMLLFAYYVPIFPIAGRIKDTIQIPTVTGFLLIDTLLAGNLAAFGDVARHIVLPAFSLSLSGIGQAARLTRSSMVDTYQKPYIEMARSFGFREGRIAWAYALRPSLIPSLTVIGLDFAALLASAFLVEQVFAWPGLSRYGVQVILRKDLNAIVGTVLIISTMFLVMNVIVDLLIASINPRIRLSQRPA